MLHHSNLTESSSKILQNRTAYVASHQPYLSYVCHLLATATLPPSEVGWANQTTMAAMVAELRTSCPCERPPNSIVLGRALHRILPSLLTWHGGRHVEWHGAVPVVSESTIYRFPQLQTCRNALAVFVAAPLPWPNEHDQWQRASCDEG